MVIRAQHEEGDFSIEIIIIKIFKKSPRAFIEEEVIFACIITVIIVLPLVMLIRLLLRDRTFYVTK